MFIWVLLYAATSFLVYKKCKGVIGYALIASYTILISMGLFDCLYIEDELKGRVLELAVYSIPLWFATAKHTKTLGEGGILLGVLLLFIWEALSFMEFVSSGSAPIALADEYVNILALAIIAISGYMGGTDGGARILPSNDVSIFDRDRITNVYCEGSQCMLYPLFKEEITRGN